MIDLASIQQQLAQPETPFDRAMSDPLFNIGIAMMSSPNIGTALQQGLQTTQSMKSNRLQNQLRLLELQAQLQPESAKPTALMRHMEIAQDPNNPLAQMMQKYLFKPTGSNVTVKMPGPVAQGMEKVPGYLGEGPKEGSFWFKDPEGGQLPVLRWAKGYTPSTQEERNTAYNLESTVRAIDESIAGLEMFKQGDMQTHLGQVAAAKASESGPIMGAAWNAVVPDPVRAYNAGQERLVGPLTKSMYGGHASDKDRQNVRNSITANSQDDPTTLEVKQETLKGIKEAIYNKGEGAMSPEDLERIKDESRARVISRFSAPAPVPQTQPPASVGGVTSTGNPALDSYLGTK